MQTSKNSGQKNAKSSAILIDFVSAKRRNMTSKAASHLQSRAKDLSATIECDSVYHSFFEHKPTKDYDNFIKNFGQSHMAQVRLQLSGVASYGALGHVPPPRLPTISFLVQFIEEIW